MLLAFKTFTLFFYAPIGAETAHTAMIKQRISKIQVLALEQHEAKCQMHLQLNRRAAILRLYGQRINEKSAHAHH
jgi:hypothetical protein